MHEIVYLQFGNLSNFIGSHFWNTQDSYSFDDADWSISWSSRTEERNAERSGVGVGAGAGVGITEKVGFQLSVTTLTSDMMVNIAIDGISPQSPDIR